MQSLATASVVTRLAPDTSHALRLYPTFVWKADRKREISQRINDDILNWLADMRQTLPGFQTGQAWQTNAASEGVELFVCWTRGDYG